MPYYNFQHNPQFFTATILEWKLLKPDEYKQIIIDSAYSPKEFFGQKLIYIHNNPLSELWKLGSYPQEYKYSSALFYEEGIDIFGLVTHFD